MKHLTYCFPFFLSIIGCQNLNTSPTNNFIELKINSNVYDSIQTFVGVNQKANMRSEVYLLDFLYKTPDSTCYQLTTLLKKSINKKYKNSFYMYNIDSSLLIINDFNNKIYDNSNIKISLSISKK
jgi:hypothetical protein